MMALQVVPTPPTPEPVMPGLPWPAGEALLIIFLLAGWIRAAGLW